MEGATPDSLIALHRAGYREVLERLGPGRVLDVGCGTASETARFAQPDRAVIGVDYDSGTALEAARSHTSLRFAAMDGSAMGFAAASFDWVCSSHIIEHFTMPECHVAELARVCGDDGTTFVITPNNPADFENPFHVYPFVPDVLGSLLRLFFADVTILGLEGDQELKADFAARRVQGERILRLDALKLRRRIPHSWYVWSYERVLPLVYKTLGTRHTGIGSGLDDSHFFIADEIVETTPVLFAIARRPRRFPEHAA
jgi:SAM-dependent methyltransferase